MTLQIIRHIDATSFLARAEAWLLEREADNNMLLSVAYLLAQGAKPFGAPAYLATVEQDGGIGGCVICPPPDGVYLTELPLTALDAVVGQLRAMFPVLPELLGPEPAATAFANRWAPGAWRINNRFTRYVLTSVIEPARPASGVLRPGRAQDMPLLEEWAAHYRQEARSRLDIAALFRTMLERRTLYLWDDDGPRCVVTASGFTPQGARISSTYTPPAFRGQGYASSAVVAVCRRLLDGGRRFCVIVADVTEPVPNAVYRKIGFCPTGEIVLVHFDTPPAEASTNAAHSGGPGWRESPS